MFACVALVLTAATVWAGSTGPMEPPNDACANMTQISGPDVGEDILIPFSTFGADTDGPSPSPAPCPTDVGWGDDLWYCWEAPCDTNATFETCGLTNLDTIISVYYSVGAPCVCPAFDTPPIACNDDACGVQSALTIPVEEGQRYLIRLGAVSGQPEGSGMLRIAIDPVCNPDPRLPADLEVTKTDDPDPVEAGSNLTYSLLVRNNGPGVAENVVLGDFLDPMVQFVSAEVSPAPGNCNYNAGEHRVTCFLGDMLPDAEKEIAIVVHVPSDAVVWERPDCGTKIISNDAWVMSRGRVPTNGDTPPPGTPDPNPGNNHTGENTTVVESADLKIIKMSKPDDEIQAGVPFLYTIIVENCGPSYARGVTIRDTILSNENFETTFVASNYPQGDATNGFTFNPIADPAGGESIELLLHPALPPKSANDTGRWWVQFEVVAFETSDINNIANVFTRGDGICPGTPDPDTSNNEAIDSISILDTSDLRVDKYATRSVRCSPDTCTDATTEGGTTATAGRQLTYRIRVQNQIPAPGEPGGSTATNVVLQDFLPAGVQFVNVSTDEGPDVDCIPGIPGDPMNPVICNLGTIDPNDTFELELTVRIDEDYLASGLYPPSVRNVACVSSDNIDPDTSDNCEDEFVTVNAVADVYVEKVADPDEVVAGEVIGYTINVGNNGCSTADDVEVIDALPEQVTFVDATVLNGTGDEVCTYNAGAHEVVCTLGDLDPGDLRVIIINATVNQTAYHVLYNRVDAYILGDTYDCYDGNNTDRTWTDVERNSDLSITKTATPDPVFAGDYLIYDVTTTNHGPSDAFGAFFIDALPPEVNYLASATDEQGFLFGDHGPCYLINGWDNPAFEDLDEDYQFLLCVVGPLPAGDSEVTRIKVQVAADAVARTECGTKTIINKALALNAELGDRCREGGGDCCDDPVANGDDCWLNGVGDDHDVVIDEDPNWLNNIAIQGTFVMDQADLSVYKASKPDDEVRAGEPFRYTIIVENWGPSFARNVFIRDDIFASGEFTVVPGSGTSNRPVNGPFPIDGPAPGESFNLALEQPLEPSTLTQDGRWIVQFDIVANDPIDINNRVEVGSYDNDVDCPGTADPDHSNNIAVDGISVTAVADLAIDKTADPSEEVYAGDDLAYHIGITNNGPSAAENVVVKDALPAGVTVVSVTGSGPNGDAGCNVGTPGDPLDPATCNFGTLDPNDAAWMNIVVTVDADLSPQLLCNNARAYSDTFDIDNSNNIDNACVNVILPNEADLEVIKSADPDPVIAGEHLIYTITVRNLGPNVAYDTYLNDQLDDDVTVVEVDASQADNCNVNDLTTGTGDEVQCDLGDLPPGATRTIRIKVHVDEDAVAFTNFGTDDLHNHVMVGSLTYDPDESNNWYDLETFVMESADLSVVKVSKPDDNVLAGEEFEYTIIVENLGPSEARAVQIVDDMISSDDVEVLEIIEDGNRNDECYIDDTDPTFQVIRCELNSPLEVQGVDGDGRWIIQVRARAFETQDVNNFVRVFTGVYDFNDFTTTGFTWENGTPDPDHSNNQAYDSISVVDTSDMKITKSAEGYVDNCIVPRTGATLTPDAVTAGRPLIYTIEVMNQIPGDGEPGGSTATNVVVKDFLPYGVEVISMGNADPNGPEFGCTPGTPGDASDPLMCNLGTLAADETAAVEIKVLVKPDYTLESATDLLQNGAYVTSDNVDPDTSDNLASNTTEVFAIADLYIDKLDAPDPVVAGESLTYAIWIANNGPSTAEQVALLDTLDEGVSFAGATILGGGGTCTYAEGAHSVACTLGDIDPGDVRIVHIEVLVDADASYVGNTAEVASLTDECIDENNRVYVSTEVVQEADLEITKSASPDPVVAGEQLLYTVTVTNNGPSVAEDVNFVDELSGYVTYVADNSPYCQDVGGNDVLCELGDLDPGESFSVEILVQVDPETVAYTELGGMTIPNHARVYTSTYDPDESNNEVDQETFVIDSADLAVTKLSLPDTNVPAGEEWVYKIIVENLGPSYSRGVKITDDIFSSGDFASVSFEGDPNRDDTCFDLGDEIAVEELTYQCMLNEPLEPVGPEGAGRWIITVRITANEPQDVHNLVRVFTGEPGEGEGDPVITVGDGGGSTGTPDPNLDNNQAIDFISVDAVADLELEKNSDVQEVAFAGDIVVYTIDVTNHGPSQAVNVVVKDFLPLHVNVQSISSTKGNCTAGMPGDPLNPAMCNLDTMDVNDVETVTITVMLDDEIPSGVLFNDAFVSANTFDADNSNNLDNESFPVEGATYADLSIFKTGKPDDVVRAGEELTYTIFVDNLGPDTAENVLLTEEIISDGTFEILSVTDDRGAVCDPTSGEFDQHVTITCELEELEPIDTAGNGRWTIVIVVTAEEGISINNEACVVSDTTDINRDNNCALTTHDVLEVSDLTIDKEDDPDPVAEGALLTYLLTVGNDGPTTAENVVVEDTLPGRVDIISVTPSQGNCTIGTPGNVADPTICNLGSLAVGAEATVEIVVRVQHLCDFSPLINNAKTYSDIFDDDISDNIVSEFTEVVDGTPPVITCPAPITVTSPNGDPLPPNVAEIAAFLNGATATDDCDPDPEITNNGPATYPLGPTEVTFTATDDFGNMASCTSTVTVVSGAPDTRPIIDDIIWEVEAIVTGQGGFCGAGMVQTMSMGMMGLMVISLTTAGRRRRK